MKILKTKTHNIFCVNSFYTTELKKPVSATYKGTSDVQENKGSLFSESCERRKETMWTKLGEVSHSIEF
jgi:hypothetical protein